MIKRNVRNAGHSSEVFKRYCLAFMENRYRSTLIQILRTSIRPSAIARFVVPIVVNTVELSSDRPRSHVRIKSREVGAPFIAHRYASAAIAVEPNVSWIKAAILSCLPRTILDGGLHSMFRVGMYANFLFSHDASRGVVVRAAVGADNTVAACVF